jgi:hypothetical protein
MKSFKVFLEKSMRM